jgi:hypothetical protein
MRQMGIKRLGLIASAVAFARSERGRRLIADARRKYDTPENRARLAETVGNLRRSGSTSVARRAR